MDNGLIAAQAIAVKFAFRRLTAINLKLLDDSVEQAVRIPGTSGWDRKAAAHAEIFNVLADVTGDPVVAPVLISGVGLSYDLMVAAGRAADGMITGSRRRMLAQLRAGAVEEASAEMGNHLRVLHHLWRMAREQRASRSQP
jgi:DNA-binding FadR family transcriptional regulator